ncbi:MAG: coenzyme F420-0:L-glutamate ligase [Proteobacteria bacterium]|nr:coenzyme F420-0:L-glutamate ligase [Pseudomonadota bacterium]
MIHNGCEPGITLNFIPIKTRIVHPPKDEIWDILDDLQLRDGDIVFITSKILGIHQGRCVPADTTDKTQLIEQEATRWLPYENPDGYGVNLTITDNILIPAAGIDASNADGHYIMWPKNVDALCRDIRDRLMRKNHLKNLGVVSTDSHSMPLRLGVTGITTGCAGIDPLSDIRGACDLFGRPLKITRVNQIDPLTAMAVLIMGEAAEQTPILILRGYKGIGFSDAASMDDLKVSPELDLYRPLFDAVAWKK